jgi:hypothetical protein
MRCTAAPTNITKKNTLGAECTSEAIDGIAHIRGSMYYSNKFSRDSVGEKAGLNPANSLESDEKETLIREYFHY